MASVTNPTAAAGRSLLLPALIAVLLFHASLATAIERRSSPARVKSIQALTFTTATTPELLLQCLLDANIQVRNATLTAADGAAGTFTGGTGIIGFEQGLALGTGQIASAVGPNLDPGTGVDNGLAGDADLDALITPDQTFDATILEYEFLTTEPRTIEFQYVFASEEYTEFVGAGFDDVVAFFLNGTAATNNIARVPTGCSGTAGIPVSVDNVNCGNAFDPQVPTTNCGCFVNNEFLPPPAPDPTLDTEMDGLTQVFTATGTSEAGWNRLKIAIADAGDGVLDSNVFIRCASFIIPARRSSWGQVKSIYR
jgi:hypothetical protein